MAQNFDLIIRQGNVVDGTGVEPFVADVAIRDDRIVEVGDVSGQGREEIDATGLLVTPGFVDIHTHYDGQLIWESRLSPSSDHGVTTVVVGNCGVGFAPCRAEDRASLIRLMEGVEDIPGVVMNEGLSWEWESFPEYLDAVERRSHDINVASYFPHSPLRVYVMGERAIAGEAATTTDIQKMATLAREALDAGALGFASSRTLFHRSSSGEYVPTLKAAEDELVGVAMALKEAGRGIIQIANDFKGFTDLNSEFALMESVARASGRDLSLPMAQNHAKPEQWRELLTLIENANKNGVNVTGQALPRGIGLLFGLQMSMHPFCLSPSYIEIAQLPLTQQVQRMRDPNFRQRLLGEAPNPTTIILLKTIREFEGMFEMGTPANYEPSPDTSIAARARCAGVTPLEFAYDLLLANDGQTIIYMPSSNYAYGNLDTVFEIFKHPNTVLGLGDGGAHCGFICDASYTTYLLSYWTRDRVCGRRFSVPEVIRAMTSDTARTVGLLDRGIVACGYKADLNLIDHAKIALHSPSVSYDLPAGGRRLSQKAEGYVATIVNGLITYRSGIATGQLPGQLVRGPQPIP